MTTHLRSAAALALITAALLAGCQSDSDDADAATAAPTTSASETAAPDSASSSTDAADSGYDGPTIPDGLWTRHMTAQQAHANAQALGISEELLEEAVGDVTTDLAFSFKVGAGVWAQYQAINGGEAEIGDSGTFTYDADGHWSTVSNSTDCPGCVGVVDWTIEGDELTLEFLPASVDDPVTLFVTEGTYQRAS